MPVLPISDMSAFCAVVGEMYGLERFQDATPPITALLAIEKAL